MRNQLLFVESNTTGTGLIALQKARTLGFLPVFLTNNPQRYSGLENSGCSILICDTNSIDSLTHTIANHINVSRVCGAVTTSEFYLETVAQLTNRYNLPGNPLQAMAICRNKAKTRLRLAGVGVRQPRFALVQSVNDIDCAFARLVQPYVVKPVDDTGSHEVLLCQTFEEAKKQVMHILQVERNVRGQKTAQAVLIEEFLNAPEFSVEMFSWQGTTKCIGITEKSLVSHPHFVEYRHIFPAPLPSDAREDGKATVSLALKRCRNEAGSNTYFTSQGCAIIEINARLAGGMIPELIRRVTKLDLLEQQIRSAVGKAPELHINYCGYAGIQFLVSDRDGI